MFNRIILRPNGGGSLGARCSVILSPSEPWDLGVEAPNPSRKALETPLFLGGFHMAKLLVLPSAFFPDHYFHQSPRDHRWGLFLNSFKLCLSIRYSGESLTRDQMNTFSKFIRNILEVVLLSMVIFSLFIFST